MFAFLKHSKTNHMLFTCLARGVKINIWFDCQCLFEIIVGEILVSNPIINTILLPPILILGRDDITSVDVDPEPGFAVCLLICVLSFIICLVFIGVSVLLCC